MSYRQPGVNVLHILFALKNLALIWNLISVRVEVVNFTMFKVDQFCKYILITACFQIFDGKDPMFVVSQSER